MFWSVVPTVICAWLSSAGERVVLEANDCMKLTQRSLGFPHPRSESVPLAKTFDVERGSVINTATAEHTPPKWVTLPTVRWRGSWGYLSWHQDCHHAFDTEDVGVDGIVAQGAYILAVLLKPLLLFLYSISSYVYCGYLLYWDALYHKDSSCRLKFFSTKLPSRASSSSVP